MSRLTQWSKYWLPVMAGMVLIFLASSDTASFQHTSRFVGPFLRRFFPGLSPEAQHAILVASRKAAHVTEYALLSMLVWRALRKPVRDEKRPWDWRLAYRALAIVALYAATDEFHQKFVPSREGAVVDVLIDVGGGLLGLFCIWVLGKLRRSW